jgi:hypothetical protein
MATDKSCTRYRRKYTFTVYMLQRCELSSCECRHICRKLSEAIAGFADPPLVVMCVSRESGKRETESSMYSEIVHF